EVDENSWKSIFPDFKFRFQYVGHIIGASFIEIETNGKKLVFSGDVGRNEDLLMKSPKRPEQADYLFLESTYGNRNHPEEDVKQILKDLILKTYEKGGTFIIPSFAVERTQTLMLLLWQLKAEKSIPQ